MKENDNRIIPKFISQAIKNKNITVFNKGEQTRSYCYIDDSITMIKNICLEGKGFVYNVGRMEEEISANELAKKVLEIVPNTKSKIIKIDYPNEYPKDEPMRRCPNIDKYLEEFKEKPRIDLKTGLSNFYQYARKIGNKILILGGGRWGQITYNNLFNTNFTQDIQIISKFLNLSKSILKNKNVRIKRKINYSKIKNYNLIIICKNNFSKIKYLKKLKDFSNILVIEKPLIIKNNIKKFLLFFSKKKFYKPSMVF